MAGDTILIDCVDHQWVFGKLEEVQKELISESIEAQIIDNDIPLVEVEVISE